MVDDPNRKNDVRMIDAEARAEILRLCRYRSLIGPTAQMDPLIGCTLIVLGGDPVPFGDEARDAALRCVRAGKVILLAADRSDLRDYAKRDLIEMLRAVGLWTGYAMAPGSVF